MCDDVSWFRRPICHVLGVSSLSTCSWKANSSLDQKAIAMERIRELRERRRRVISALMMAKRKEIDSYKQMRTNLKQSR